MATADIHIGRQNHAMGWLVTLINERLQRTQVTCNLFEHCVEWQWSWIILHATQLKDPERTFFYIYPCVHYFYISCFRTFCWHENCESELKGWHFDWLVLHALFNMSIIFFLSNFCLYRSCSDCISLVRTQHKSRPTKASMHQVK